jgi:AAA domain
MVAQYESEHQPTNGATHATETPSAAYAHLLSATAAYEMWEILDHVGKLNVIRTHFDPTQWLEPEPLSILAHFRHQPPGIWEQLKLAYKAKGGNPFDLQAAVDRQLQVDGSPQARWDPVSAPLSSFTIRRKQYVWYPLIPEAEPTSLEGGPNVGKSATLIKLFCHLTSGTRFPTLFAERPEQDFAPRQVLLFTYEDDPESTILPRVMLNGGNPALVEIIQGKRDPETKALLPMTLQDLYELDVLLTRLKPALMAFDPLQSFFGPEVDMNRADDTRPVLDRVAALGKAHGCTPLYIRHNGKSQRAKAIHSALGSIDITAHMRSVLTLYWDPDDTARRILAHTKKHGREAPSMNLKLVGATLDVPTDVGWETIEEVRVEWDGKSDLTSEDLNARESAHGNDTQEAQSSLEQAREFLREVLRDGPMPVEDLLVAAKHAGVKRRTLDRAKDKEGVKARRVPSEGVPSNKWPWEWHAPRPPTERP